MAKLEGMEGIIVETQTYTLEEVRLGGVRLGFNVLEPSCGFEKWRPWFRQVKLNNEDLEKVKDFLASGCCA